MKVGIYSHCTIDTIVYGDNTFHFPASLNHAGTADIFPGNVAELKEAKKRLSKQVRGGKQNKATAVSGTTPAMTRKTLIDMLTTCSTICLKHL